MGSWRRTVRKTHGTGNRKETAACTSFKLTLMVSRRSSSLGPRTVPDAVLGRRGADFAVAGKMGKNIRRDIEKLTLHDEINRMRRVSSTRAMVKKRPFRVSTEKKKN